MTRIFFLTALLAIHCLISACASVELKLPDEYRFDAVITTVTSRGVEVPVTYTTPIVDQDVTFPLVVMAHGHGTSREEGGGYATVSENLARNGVASIRMDFPGCGDSTESFTENNLSNMLADLQAAGEFALADASVNEERLGLLGFSMGARLVALLSAIDPRYKAMVMWAPAVANGAEREHQSFGGPQVYHRLRSEAEETGRAPYTTSYGQDLELGLGWFTDMEKTLPLLALSEYAGAVLVVYGAEDTAVPPDISEAAIAAATRSSEVIRYRIEGIGHDLGFYSDRADVAADVVATSVDFLTERL